MAISKKIASFMESSSFIRKMFEEGAKLKAQHGVEKVCDFSIGNPDVPPPEVFQRVLEEEAQKTDPNIHGYMPNAGYPAVRTQVAQFINLDQGTQLDASHVLMTSGAGGALNVALKTILNQGDEVLVPSPYFVEYRFYCDNHGGELKPVACKDNFDLDIEALEEAVTPQTAAIIINSPNNPSGRIYPLESLKALAEMLTRKSAEIGRTIYLLGDEPYRKISYGDPVPSLLKVYRNSLICTSYSKDLSLPGERIGWLAINPEADDLQGLINGCTLCNRILGYVNAGALMQRVVGRLQGAQVDVAIYRRKRDALKAILDELGYKYCPPQGTFYFFVESPLENEMEFVDLLKKELILTVPGRGFGKPGYFRISYCCDDKYIELSKEGFRRAMEQAKNQ